MNRSGERSGGRTTNSLPGSAHQARVIRVPDVPAQTQNQELNGHYELDPEFFYYKR